MNAKIQIVLIITCIIFLGFVSANNAENRFQSTGSFPKEQSDFIAKETVVTITTPKGSLLIDCRHENPTTLVSLLFTRVLDRPFLDITSNDNIVQLGQAFILSEVSTGDDGYYMCARRDGHGKAKIVVEVFVMEEENIYSGFSDLKHAFENQAVEEIEPFVQPSDNVRTSTDVPPVTDLEEIIPQQNVTISEGVNGSINRATLEHVPAFTQDHLATQNALDHMTSFCNDTSCGMSSSSHNGLDDLIPVTNITSGHVSYITPIALDHVTVATNQTSGHVSYIAQIALDHVISVAKVTSSHVASIASFVMEWMRSTSHTFLGAIARIRNSSS